MPVVAVPPKTCVSYRDHPVSSYPQCDLHARGRPRAKNVRETSLRLDAKVARHAGPSAYTSLFLRGDAVSLDYPMGAECDTKYDRQLPRYCCSSLVGRDNKPLDAGR